LNKPKRPAHCLTQRAEAMGRGRFAKEIDMAETLQYRGYEIDVMARQNASGAWVPQVGLRCAGAAVDFRPPETTQPEWLTEAEAIRAGIERAHYFIDHATPPGPTP
jgi:hypothetical protein